MADILNFTKSSANSTISDDTLGTLRPADINAPRFQHKSFEDRLAQYCGKITVYDFEWGAPQGKEIL